MAKSAAQPLITVLHGDAEVLKGRALRRIIHDHVGQDDSADALLQFWGKEVHPRDMAGAIGSVSLFTDKRVVVLREFQLIPAREQKPLESVLNNLPQDTIVAITSRPKESDRDTRKPPLNAEIARTVKASGKVELFLSPRRADELRGWAQSEVASGGKTIGSQALGALLETVGADYDRMHHEIDKLIAYAGAEPEITVEAVRACALSADDRTIFNFTDALGRRDLPTALGIIRVLLPEEAQRGEAISIVGQIARHLRLLWQTTYAMKHTRSLENLPEAVEAVFPDEHGLGKELKSKPFLARVMPQQARNFTEAQLARAMVKVYETDMALKGLSDEQMDERTLVETLVIALCRK